MLDMREKDLEKIVIWEHLNKKEASMPGEPRPGWEEFKEYKTAMKRFVYEVPFYRTLLDPPLPNIMGAWLVD
eukprot:5951661-Prorocentrum_lima.AAC.1